ncbi:hypothetical protein MZO42_05970 [Sphingomonas psychrotolerans]|uniref:LamG domain-containing protein n=1 Tax=Sphingomonas psychrotolerans TaxID=1327635 RepID=A0ABU3N179_9SPHN|nr:hypothetical protein [Sphingomonas psychrotolerans]MDT8758238.1 hypothetical protein [Sphingomonas psychrotolerans]
MTSWPVIVLPIDANPTGYSVDPGDLLPMFNGIAEPDASGHWLFGSDNPEMLDLVSRTGMVRSLGAILTAGGAGYTTPPTVERLGTGQSVVGKLGVTINGAGQVTSLFQTDPGSPDASAAGTIVFSGGGGAGALALSPRAPAPTMNDGYLTVANAGVNGINGLEAPIDIDVNQTLCLVFKRKPLAASTLILGRWMGTGTGAAAMLQLDAASYGAYSRAAGVNFAGDKQATPPPAGAVGDWLFVAMTHTPTQRMVFWGGGNNYVSAGALNLANKTNCRVGFCENDNFNYTGGLDVAEFIVFPRALTAGELANVFNRSAARLAPRGITLLGA